MIWGWSPSSTPQLFRSRGIFRGPVVGYFGCQELGLGLSLSPQFPCLWSVGVGWLGARSLPQPSPQIQMEESMYTSLELYMLSSTMRLSSKALQCCSIGHAFDFGWFLFSHKQILLNPGVPHGSPWLGHVVSHHWSNSKFHSLIKYNLNRTNKDRTLGSQPLAQVVQSPGLVILPNHRTNYLVSSLASNLQKFSMFGKTIKSDIGSIQYRFWAIQVALDSSHWYICSCICFEHFSILWILSTILIPWMKMHDQHTAHPVWWVNHALIPLCGNRYHIRRMETRNHPKRT